MNFTSRTMFKSMLNPSGDALITSLSSLIHRSVMRKITRRYGFKDRGVKPGLFYVLALSKRPAALIEVGFISNQSELKKMSSPSFQNRFSNAIVRGIKKYYKKNKIIHPQLF